METTTDDVYVLDSAIHKLLSPKKPARAKVKPGDPEHARLEAFFRAVQIIQGKPSLEEIAAFDDVLKIDPGEAILFSSPAAYS